MIVTVILIFVEQLCRALVDTLTCLDHHRRPVVFRHGLHEFLVDDQAVGAGDDLGFDLFMIMLVRLGALRLRCSIFVVANVVRAPTHLNLLFLLLPCLDIGCLERRHHAFNLFFYRFRQKLLLNLRTFDCKRRWCDTCCRWC